VSDAITGTPTAERCGTANSEGSSDVQRCSAKNKANTLVDTYPDIGGAMAFSTPCTPSLFRRSFRRCTSAIRTACATERSSISASVAPGENVPSRRTRLAEMGPAGRHRRIVIAMDIKRDQLTSRVKTFENMLITARSRPKPNQTEIASCEKQLNEAKKALGARLRIEV
jgi:hypothetical protein